MSVAPWHGCQIYVAGPRPANAPSGHDPIHKCANPLANGHRKRRLGQDHSWPPWQGSSKHEYPYGSGCDWPRWILQNFRPTCHVWPELLRLQESRVDKRFQIPCHRNDKRWPTTHQDGASHGAKRHSRLKIFQKARVCPHRRIRTGLQWRSAYR